MLASSAKKPPHDSFLLSVNMKLFACPSRNGFGQESALQRHAATFCKKASISFLRSIAAASATAEAASTVRAEVRVSLAALATSPMTDAIAFVPSAAFATLFEI